MNLQIIEYFLVGCVILVQIVVFFTTKARISNFKNIFENIATTTLSKHYIPLNVLSVTPVLEILKDLPKFRDSYGANSKDSIYNWVKINLINEPESKSVVLQRIIFSINTYLIKSRGAASDFHLLKDVTERNCDALEGEINNTISVPLYLGLVGTLIGIVIGLSSLNLGGINDTDSQFASSIEQLLSSVKVAMVASLTGLILTILNSALFFKTAKAKVEKGKNIFYTFLQTELLPVLTDSVASTLHTLQSNFASFNNSFSDNIRKMTAVMEANNEDIKQQAEILQALKEIDIMSFAKANVTVFKELQKTTSKFEVFNSYAERMSDFIESIYKLTNKIQNLFERTENFAVIAEEIKNTVNLNGEMIKFITSHKSILDDSKQDLVKSLSGVNSLLDATMSGLEDHSRNRTTQLQVSLNSDTLELKETLRANMVEFQKLIEEMQSKVSNAFSVESGNIERLQLLTPINENLQDIKAGDSSKETIRGILELDGKLSKIVNSLESINSKTEKKLVPKYKINKKKNTNGDKDEKKIASTFWEHLIFWKKRQTETTDEEQ